MTPEEAIKLQSELQSLLPEVGFDKYLASGKLGIEALERIQEQRRYFWAFRKYLLPGETKD